MENKKTGGEFYLLWLIPVIMLTITLFSSTYDTVRRPYDSQGYYQLLRIVVSISLGIILYLHTLLKKDVFVFIISFLIILYNPLLKIHFRKSVWLDINQISILLILFHMFLYSRKIKNIFFASKEVIIPFKTPENAFKYACEYCVISTKKGDMGFGIVEKILTPEVDSEQYLNSLQKLLIKVPDDKGGRVIFSQTYGSKGPLLIEGDVVLLHFCGGVEATESRDLLEVALVVAKLNPCLFLEAGMLRWTIDEEFTK